METDDAFRNDRDHELGRDYMEAGQLAQAIKTFLRILARSPNDDWAQLQLALCWVHTGQYQDAETLLDQLVQLHPNAPGIWEVLGESYRRRFKFDPAREASERALALKPDSHEARRLRSMIEFDAKQFEAAADWAERALQLAPDDAHLLWLYAQALAYCDRLEDAREVNEQALRLHPEDFDALALQAALLMTLNRPKDAIDLYESCLRLDPGNKDLQIRLAEARRKARQTSWTRDQHPF
ncbi:MAG: tetratricopeptide repeat protein [Planctomycetota bacterium]